MYFSEIYLWLWCTPVVVFMPFGLDILELRRCIVVVVVVVVVEVEVVWLLKIFLVLLEQNKIHTLNGYLGFCRSPF